MTEEARPGPKPRRLYLRVVRTAGAEPEELPARAELAAFVQNLEREGRLVAHGALVGPAGDLVVVRAVDRAEAERTLRPDPFRELPGVAYELLEWSPRTTGTNINLDPPPGRGSGRLTTLLRVAVAVRDRERSIAWYRDVLGLTVRHDDPETGYVEMSLGKGGSGIALVEPVPTWGEPYYSEAVRRIGTSTGIVFQTDSVAALELRLRHARALVTQPPERQPWGGATLRFVDPDGNEFLAFGAEPTRAASRTPPGPVRTGRVALPRTPARRKPL